MIGLDATQRLFFRAIAWPSGVSDFLDKSGEQTRSDFESVFGESTDFNRQQRVDVYANAYFHRLLGALEELLPRLAFLCGEIGFHNLVTDYVLQCPSESPDLRHLGDRLPGFLRTHALGRRYPLLVQVAEVELALSRALDAPDCELVCAEQLRAVPPDNWPDLRFRLAPAVSRLSCHWQWELLERDCQNGKRASALQSNRSNWPTVLLVARRSFAVYSRVLPYAEAFALQQLQAGCAFGEACDRVARELPGFSAQQMVLFLQQWLQGELLAFRLNA